jgi:hypothetical protein
MAAVDELATRIAREHGKPDQSEEARMAAEAEVRILRIRAARARLLDLMADDSATNAKQLQSESRLRHSSHRAACPLRPVQRSDGRTRLTQAISDLLICERYPSC